MEKLEDITKSMRQWVERIGQIPSHEIVAKLGKPKEEGEAK